MTTPLSRQSISKRADTLAGFFRRSGRMPSYAETADLLGLRSKSAAFKVIAKLEASGAVRKDDTGRLLPGSIARPIRLLGTIEAGFPSPAEEELRDTISLDDMLIQNRQATYLLKVSGDSMSGAGIMPGDMVIVDRSRSAKSGDIVIAQVDGEWTMKYLRKTAGAVVLVPANPKYKPIKPKTELKVAGVVTAVVRKYG